jgi:hypothetical protein
MLQLMMMIMLSCCENQFVTKPSDRDTVYRGFVPQESVSIFFMRGEVFISLIQYWHAQRTVNVKKCNVRQDPCGRKMYAYIFCSEIVL